MSIGNSWGILSDQHKDDTTMDNEARERILKCAALIKERVKEYADGVGITLEKIEWDESILSMERDATKDGPTRHYKSNYILSLTAKGITHTEDFSSQTIDDCSLGLVNEQCRHMVLRLRQLLHESTV
jgi:hypothetical protein